ncbi:uncharacterized protein LOC104887464 [Beta vulgaris subsp. vulgaris]|uniref:uncharacterized protein LOC104887464 n=1 Tax=Beta vulgaris subsp. vulgaris TaxID=3555 RepID=UPI0025498656|nr:uncharacterized protein LOC104887464 [Beta vulgaris subsp. vulgaris]
MRFGRKGKLSPRYIGPYEVLERIGEVAYRLALPTELANVHNVFHVSQLHRYVHDPTHILQPETVELDQNLSFENRPIMILDTKTRNTRRKVVRLVKVLWSNQKIEEATWEAEDAMRNRYPELFPQIYQHVQSYVPTAPHFSPAISGILLLLSQHTLSSSVVECICYF